MLLIFEISFFLFIFRYSENIRVARYDDERITYEREYLKKVDHRDSVRSFSINSKYILSIMIDYEKIEIVKKIF